MSDSGGIPELQCSHPDGRPRTRLEMDEWLRKEIPKVFWLRIHACRTLGLPKQISWDMREVVLRHWILDELIRRQLIVGDQLGVNQNASNDESELRQFTQRLAALLQTGQAIQPRHTEGIDMNGYTPPPPPMGGVPQQPQQTAYTQPPPAPPGPPMGPGGYPSAPPGPPPGPPQYQQPQQPPSPPAGPPGYAPPPAGVPMGPPPMQAGPAPMGPPAAGPPAPPGGRRGKRADAPQQQMAPPPAGPVPPMNPGAPQGFAPVGAVPTGYAPPIMNNPMVPGVQGVPQGLAQPPQAYQQPPQQSQPQPQQQTAPQVDLSAIHAKLDQVLNHLNSLAAKNAVLEKNLGLLSMTVVLIGRSMFQKAGVLDSATFLTDCDVQIPQ